jgi:parallel beta-helix repeat protein
MLLSSCSATGWLDDLSAVRYQEDGGAPGARPCGLIWTEPKPGPNAHFADGIDLLRDHPGPLPSAVDNSAGLPPVGNQGWEGSCTAWAIGYYHASYIEAQEKGLDLSDPANQTSPAYLYNMANGGVDDGSYMGDVADLLVAGGAPSMEDFPYHATEYTTWPDGDWIYTSGMHRKAESYTWVELADAASLGGIKAYLAAGNTITTALWVWDNYYDIENYGCVYTSADKSGENRGGHVLCICGYDDDMPTADGTGAFRLVNSWGAGWGDAGYFWMSYEAMLDPDLCQGWALYLDSEMGYQPSMIARVHMDHETRGSIIANSGLRIDLDVNGSAAWSKVLLGPFLSESWAVPYQPYPFTGDISFDISDAIPSMAPTGDNIFSLHIFNSGPTAGTLASFEILNVESWTGGISWDTPMAVPSGAFSMTEAWIYEGWFVHAPLHVEGELDMRHQAIGEFWQGDGSEANPYVLHDYYMSGMTYCNGIYVANTTCSIDIDRCYVEEAHTDWSDPYVLGAGIFLNNVSNVDITDGTMMVSEFGIVLMQSHDISVVGCEVSDDYYGVYLTEVSNVLVRDNDVAYSTEMGIIVELSTNVSIHHNNIYANGVQGWNEEFPVAWDDGYPSGGNYWDDYSGSDVFSGPGQDVPGPDGIGDSPYADIQGWPGGAKDYYPLMVPWAPPSSSGPVLNVDTGERFPTIQAAIDAPGTLGGHRIVADNGTYRESVLVDKPVNLTGRGATVIDGGGLGDGVTITANCTEVGGLAVTNCTLGGASAAVRLLASDCKLAGTELSNSSMGVAVGEDFSYANSTVDSTFDFQAGIKSESSDSYEVETALDNPSVAWGDLMLASLYGDGFMKADANGVNWKWQDGNGKIYGTGVSSSQTKNFDLSRTDAGYMALNSVTATDDLGIMGPAQINCTSSWDMQIDFTKVYSENNNQWMFGFCLYKDWDGSGIPSSSNFIRFIYYGYSAEMRYYVDFYAGGVSQGGTYVTTAHVSGKLRATYNSATNTMGFYYWSGSSWTSLWSKVYDIDAWKLKILVPLTSYSTGLPDIRMEFDNFLFSGRFATAPYRTSGSWTSPAYPIPANNSFLSTTLTCSGMSATERIDRVEWLVNGTPVAACENDILANGTHTITEAGLTSGSFGAIVGSYQVKVYLVGGGWKSPTLGSVSSVTRSGTGMGPANSNLIENNTIRGNGIGAAMLYSSGNSVIHNNFEQNAVQAFDDGANSWDAGYPSGGNYWDDHDCPDLFSGPAQDVPGCDAIGDDPYAEIQGSAGAEDAYPFVAPWDELILDESPPSHSGESPAIGGVSSTISPVISVRVTDASGVSLPTIMLYVDGFPVFYDIQPIADGYNVSYWHEMGFASDTTVFVRIVASDAWGNLLDFTWQFTTPLAFDIPVVLGWNLVSIPLASGQMTLPEQLADADTLWDRAICYSPATPSDRWKQYNKLWSGGLNDLSYVSTGTGVWLHVTAIGDGLLRVSGTEIVPGTANVWLRAGWNLIGYPSLTPMSVADAFWGTSVSIVEAFDPGQPYLTRALGPDEMMAPGRGYWVYAVTDAVWTLGW